MGLLQELPSPESFEEILATVVGDEASGTGIAGVLGLLRQFDPSARSASLSAELGGSFKANVQVDAAGVTAGPIEHFEQAIRAFPTEPAGLVGPLGNRLATLRGLIGPDLPSQIINGVEGLRGLESLAPVDTSVLVAAAATAMESLKAQLTFGAFAELREWSTTIRVISAEIQPLLSSGPGSVEDRLIEYLAARIGELIGLLLPGQVGLAASVVNPLRIAVSHERLAAVAAARRELVERMNLARLDLLGGNVTNTAHLAASEAAFARLTGDLASLLADISAALDTEIANPERLLGTLQERLDDLADADIVDLGNIRQRIASAIGEVQQTIREIDLQGPVREVGALFDRVDSAIENSQLRALGARVEDLAERIRAPLDGIDSAIFEVVATVRNLFTRLKEALHGVALALGHFDAEGGFHFTAEREIAEFLESVRAGLQEHVEPLLEQFRSSIGQVLDEVAERLKAVRGQIESVKRDLRAALEGLPARLQANVTAGIGTVRKELQTMVDQLGRVDFEMVVDPVIAQIEDLREKLAGIDVSGLNEILLGTLRLSVKVVIEVDFSAQITNKLMQEIDRLLQIPRNGLAEIEGSAEAALRGLAALEPSVILGPLEELYSPIQELLGKIELESLTEPIDVWYRGLVGELDQLDPTTLLRPLNELYPRIRSTFDAVAPEALVRPLQELLESLRAEVRTLDLDGLARELSEAVGRARQLLESLSPARLLGPLVTLFDKILAVLDAFDPAALLEPFTGLFDRIADPLERLTVEHARSVGLAFAPLKALPERLDPRLELDLVRQGATETLEVLRQLDVGRLIAELKGPYDELRAALDVADPGEGSLAVDVEALHPLRHPILTSAAAELQAILPRLQSLATVELSADLERRYAEIRPKLEALTPRWVGAEPTPADVRQAFAQANPLAVGAEINSLWQAFKEQLGALSPRAVQERLQTSHDRLLDAIFSLSPERLLAALRAALDELVGNLEALDLTVFVAELRDLSADVQVIVTALDPAPVVSGLTELAGDVKRAVAALNPAEALRQLNEPLAVARTIIREFEPAALAEPLREVFEQIQAVVEEIDVGVVLEPLSAKLTELRDDLEANLQRVETAFNAMIAAIPVTV